MALSISLNPDQEKAQEQILAWLERPTGTHLTIGGYAGTGKTTLIGFLRKRLSDTYNKEEKKSVAFCSYTGKAASVLSQKLKDADALFPADTCSTIHRLIYNPVTDLAGQVIGWESLPSLPHALIIIDEGSMVNAEIWADLLRYHLPILVFGDHGQLPPVEGSFNLMQNPHIKLEKIVRQAEDNAIIRLSQSIRDGGGIPFGNFAPNIRKLSKHSSEAEDLFASLVTEKDDDYLCICCYNKTRVALNYRIRGLKDFTADMPEKGERIICLKNNHAKLIFNGMLGIIKQIEEEGEHWYQVKVNMEDANGPFKGTILKYQFGQQKTLRGEAAARLPIPEKEFGDLFDYGYCLTAHKAQGSEARRVILFEERMFSYDDEMWQRWLYTAVTRAKEELIVFA